MCFVASVYYIVGIIILSINDNNDIGMDGVGFIFTIVGILTYILYFVSSYNTGVVS